MRGIGHHFFDDPADLAQFFHQVGLIVQAAGGIDNDDIRSPGDPALDRIESDGARSAPMPCLTIGTPTRSLQMVS